MNRIESRVRRLVLRLPRRARAARRFAPLLALGALLCVGAQSPPPARRPDPGLTAHRPQDGAGYFPFARTAVPDALEEDPQLGPGIRRNGVGELDPAGEDDLIEVVVERSTFVQPLAFERDAAVLAVWTTRDETPGTELAFSGDVSAPIPFGGGDSATVWVEWVGAAGGTAALELVAGTRDFDRLVFHAFEGLVVALGGEDQVPQLPVDPNHGTYVVATALYEQGWDVLLRDEDGVGNTGDGAVFDAVENAITRRGVTQIAVFGYSHGAGSTYHLVDRLAVLGLLGGASIEFTSYVDAVENDSNLDFDSELRLPMGTAFHANHYQQAFFLSGGPVTNSNPPPTGLDVETTPWGAGATHFTVDDLQEVIDYVRTTLEPRVAR